MKLLNFLLNTAVEVISDTRWYWSFACLEGVMLVGCVACCGIWWLKLQPTAEKSFFTDFMIWINRRLSAVVILSLKIRNQHFPVPHLTMLGQIWTTFVPHRHPAQWQKTPTSDLPQRCLLRRHLWLKLLAARMFLVVSLSGVSGKKRTRVTENFFRMSSWCIWFAAELCVPLTSSFFL